MANSNFNRFQIDMCHGPLFSKILVFAYPLITTFVLQLLFNAADLIVIGRFSSKVSLGAVGSTGALMHLMIGSLLGIASGANVLIARFIGAREPGKTSKALHTSIAFACWSGIVMLLLGWMMSAPAIRLMRTPVEIAPKAILYVRICFIGTPFLNLYNFGSAILRSIGDTRRPMYYMIIAGLINVVLNLLFVVCFHWDVAGVALATAISQVFSGMIVLRQLVREPGQCQVFLNRVKIHWSMMKELLYLGIPTALQSASFALSNLVIQGAINSFGTEAVAGSAAAASLEGVVYVLGHAMFQAVTSFTSQNYGGRHYGRIKSSIQICIGISTVLTIVVGGIMVACGRPLIALYNNDSQVIQWGMQRMCVLMPAYCFCAMMDIFSGAARGMGCSVPPAIATIVGLCVLRLFWVMFILPLHHTMPFLLLCYPISWIIIGIVNGQILRHVMHKIKRKFAV